MRPSLCAKRPDVLPSDSVDTTVSLHETSQRAAERADEAIARGDLEVGYASIGEAYAALDALYGHHQARDLVAHARLLVPAAQFEPVSEDSAGSETLLLWRVFIHFVLVIGCLPLIATYPRARALMLDRQAELRSARLRRSPA